MDGNSDAVQPALQGDAAPQESRKCSLGRYRHKITKRKFRHNIVKESSSAYSPRKTSEGADAVQEPSEYARQSKAIELLQKGLRFAAVAQAVGARANLAGEGVGSLSPGGAGRAA